VSQGRAVWCRFLREFAEAIFLRSVACRVSALLLVKWQPLDRPLLALPAPALPDLAPKIGKMALSSKSGSFLVPAFRTPCSNQLLVGVGSVAGAVSAT
jgi:hypothetical protein